MKSLSKKVCTNERVMVAGVDVSDHVSQVDTHHQVGALISCTVTFLGVRIEEELTEHGGVRQVFHLVEREADNG